MLVTLIGNDTMNKITLPNIVEGNYWISDKNSEREKKLINIHSSDGKWQVTSNDFARLIDLNAMPKMHALEKIELEEHQMYGILIGESKELFVLYCSPVLEEKYFHVDINNANEINIGNGTNNDICYKNKLISERHARIYLANGKWVVQNYDNRFGTFVNGKAVHNKGQMLFNGDVIFIMGLKIIIMGKSIFISAPKNNIICNNNIFTPVKKETQSVEEEKEEYMELYSDKDYFSRAPRITNVIEREKVKIDAPPQMQDKEEMPLILSIGTSLSMGTMMIISVIRSLDSYFTGSSSIKQMLFSLIPSVAMLICMVFFPLFTAKYNRKKKKRYEEKRQTRYKEYLSTKKQVINDIMEKQKNILFDNNLSPEECSNVILNKGSRLWERKIEDYDFLKVRLGTGEVPLNLDIQYPEEKFTMEDDNLVEILNQIAEDSKIIKSAPIVTSLVENNVSALVSQREDMTEKFMQSLIMQLITFQSYEDLKLVFLLKEDKQEKWEYVKMLPHVWNNTKQIRFFADDYDDMKELSLYLEEILQKRLQNSGKDYRAFAPYFLIITDDYRKIENLKVIREILKTKVNVGFSILCITNDLMQLPNECKTFINLEPEIGMVFQNEIASNTQQAFNYDIFATFFFDKISRILSNIPIRYQASGVNLLPNSYTFLEMYDVGCIEQLNILERWNKNDSTLSLKAPIGVDNSKMPIVLDIHEKFHGPHGLIAGSTGSGKSEFIITYILSLAINYHPDDVRFILIDYKGGGLAGAFQKNKIKLPHLVGTITNIDTNGLQRSLASIQSELRRRQVVFNKARENTDEGTIDIYKYQKLYHEGIVDEPISHLLIICDEFAELKQQQPDFMEELMSVSRIGRSLGVHLILATQKPAGIVNDQIRSNSKFAICLRVQDRQDSSDVIKRPDAASLKRSGQFYMQVGNDEYFVMGQSGWSGAPYFPSNVTEKKVDNSIEFVSNIGTTVKRVDDAVQKVISNQGEQLTNTVKYLDALAKENGIHAESLWLEDIPDTIYVQDLREKYSIKDEKNKIEAIIGEYDDPYNQKQGIVSIKLSDKENTIVFGNAESGKETLLSTMIYDTITNHTSEEVQMYLLDFGSEALKIYKDTPHVGDIIFINDAEKVDRFFDMIYQEIQKRKVILSDYNGNYDLYLNECENPMPMILCVINNYEGFNEVYKEAYEEIFQTITREGIKYGISFVVTVSSYTDMRYRSAQNFKKKIALQLNKEDDYYNILERVGRKRPAHIFGRGLIPLENDQIYEFQTAKVSEPKEYNSFIKQEIEVIKQNNTVKAKPVPVLPNKVAIEDVKEYLKDLSSVPIGITKKDLKPYKYNFKKNFLNIITSRNIEDAVQFVVSLMQEMQDSNNIETVLFDAERIISTAKNNLKEDYIKFVAGLGTDTNKEKLCIIIGVDKFINDFDNINNNLNTTFYATLKHAEQTKKCNYIIVENANKLKGHEYDEWYKQFGSKENGIWVGNGVENQYLMTITSERRNIINNCGRSFGYPIKQGVATLVKLLELSEEDDGDE